MSRRRTPYEDGKYCGLHHRDGALESIEVDEAGEWHRGWKDGKAERMELLRRKEIEPYSIHDFEEMQVWLNVEGKGEYVHANDKTRGVQTDCVRKPPTSERTGVCKKLGAG